MAKKMGGNATKEDTSRCQRQMKRKKGLIIELEARVLEKRQEVLYSLIIVYYPTSE